MIDAEPTDEELSNLATEIYWNLEHGENKEAVQALRELIRKAQDRVEYKGA